MESFHEVSLFGFFCFSIVCMISSVDYLYSIKSKYYWPCILRNCIVLFLSFCIALFSLITVVLITKKHYTIRIPSFLCYSRDLHITFVATRIAKIEQPFNARKYNFHNASVRFRIRVQDMFYSFPPNLDSISTGFPFRSAAGKSSHDEALTCLRRDLVACHASGSSRHVSRKKHGDNVSWETTSG